MLCFILCRLARQVLWGGMRWRQALDVLCGRQTEIVKAFLNERGLMMGEVFVDAELEALKKMYVWRKGHLMGWLKRNEFEHLPSMTRAAIVWVVLGRKMVKLTKRDVNWAGNMLKVCEGLRVCGRKWPRRSDKKVVIGGLKKGNLKEWLKRQMKAYEARRLPARYRHVLEVLSGDMGVW